jgi:hypothetical protein
MASSVTDKGVFLNERGIAEAKTILLKIGSPKIGRKEMFKIDASIKAEPSGKRPRTVHPEDLIKRLRNSRLFQMYLASKWSEAEAIDLIGFLGVYDHTPSREKKRRLKEFESAATELDDSEALQFIQAILSSFGAYLAR